MTIRITGDGPKITATGSGSTVLVEISTGQHDPGSFSGVHNDLTGRSTTGAHVGTAVSIDPTGFAGNLDGTITNAQLLAAAVDDLTTGGGGGGGGGASLSDATPQALGTAAAGTGTAAARDDHVHAMPTASDVGAAATAHASAHASAGSDPVTLAQSQVTNLTTDLAAKVPTTRTVNGHALSADVTITASDVGAQPSDADLTTIAGLTATTDSFIQAKSSAWAARTIAQVKTDLGVGAAAFHVTIPVGDYVGMSSPNVAAATPTDIVTSAAGRGTVSLVWLPAATFDRMSVYVSSGGTATLRLGLYSTNTSTGMPGSLVFDAGTISTASTGLIEATINQTLSGWYWVAVVSDAHTSGYSLMGYSDSTSPAIFGMPSLTTSSFRQRIAYASTAWGTGGLPSSVPTFSSIPSAAPKVVFRRSA